MGIFIDQKFNPNSWNDPANAEIEVRNSEILGEINSDALKSARGLFTAFIANIDAELAQRREG